MSDNGGVDLNTPRTVMEEAEEGPEPCMSIDDGVEFIRHVMSWILDTKNISSVVVRAYVCCYMTAPSVVQGVTLQQIGALAGQGRSSAHNLAKQFEKRFGVRSNHARSQKARAAYSEAYARAHGTAQGEVTG